MCNPAHTQGATRSGGFFPWQVTWNMNNEPKAEQPTWATRPLNIHDLLEAARESILGCNPSVPVSSLSRSEIGLVNTILERHYKVSLQREHTGYRHIRTCRQLPPIAPHARAALAKAQTALDAGAAPEQALDVARSHMRAKASLDIQPLCPDLPLRLDVTVIRAAEAERAATVRAAGTEREAGTHQQWTVHQLAIEAAGAPPVALLDVLESMYEELPESAWERRATPA